MPLQLSWAAMASYCQHKTGAAAKHFGHHDHQHKAADGKEKAPDPAKTGGNDLDCASHVAIFPTIRAPEMACPRLIGGERVSSLVVTKAVALSA